MNSATVMGKIKNVPKLTKNENGEEQAIFLVEVERNFKNVDGKFDKDTIECRLNNPEGNFKEEFAKGVNVAVKGRLDVDKKAFGENLLDDLFVDVEQLVSLNKNKNVMIVSILGYMANDPELRETETGKKVTNIVVGTVKERKDDEPTFIRSTVWNGRAENVTKYCKKGDLVNITGKLRTNNRENENEKVSFTELVADNIIYIHSKNRDSLDTESTKEQELE